MITLQDLIDRFGEAEIINLTDKTSYQAINETVANHAIQDATSEIVAYLNPTGLIADGVYLGTPPKALKLKACDIARYYLYENGVTEIVEARYKQAIDWLVLVSKNPVMLTGVVDNDKPTGAKVVATVYPNPMPSMWH